MAILSHNTVSWYSTVTNHNIPFTVCTQCMSKVHTISQNGHQVSVMHFVALIFFFLRWYFTFTRLIFLDIYLHLLSLRSHPVQISSVFQKYEELIETLHISDQYTGVIDDTAEDDSGGVVVKVPERKIIFTYTGECSKTPGLL